MVFFTGDIHGNDRNITRFVNRVNPKITDTIVLLGDVGANYFGNRKDIRLKERLNDLGVHLLCIHGNHEMRPTNVPGYHEIEWNGGTVWIQPEFPKDSESDRLAKLILRHDAALKATMNESEIELFGKFKDAVTELNCLNECEDFINGFRLGIRLMVEALHTEE